MLCASNRKFSKTFIADFTFDIERERTRYPLFLNRNIMRVLDHHAKRTRPDPRPSTVANQNGASRPKPQIELVTPPPRSTRLRDQLIEKFHQEDAELIFDIRSIRRKLNYRENLGERPRKRIKCEPVVCRCYLAVWDNREGYRQLEPILKRSVDCTVTPADTTLDAHAVAIELQLPFRVSARELFVSFRTKAGEILKWAIGDKYLLEIKIIPCNTSELWPPMPILSKSEDSLAVKGKDLAFTQGMLISNYANLPHAPPPDVPLNVAFDQGGRTFKTKYGLEVKAEWTYPHIHEAKLKRERGILAKRMEEEEATDPLCQSMERNQNAKSPTSTPREADKSLLAKPVVKVSYVWDIVTQTALPKESRTTSLEGFHCPVCHIREFVNLKRLQFHLSNNHDKYRFTLEGQDQNPQTEKPRCFLFRVQAAEVACPPAANHLKDEREFRWQRPQRLFNIDAYICGDHSWVGALRRRTTTATQSQELQPKGQEPPLQATEAPGSQTASRLPTEVPELPIPIRKKFQVPVAQTRNKTSFYRSINHRTMETGELLSETDDDIDDGWLIKKHHDTTAEMDGLTEAEKRFRQRWDTHVMSEGSPCARYISSSLIRFARGNAAWLRGSEADQSMFVQFLNLTSILLERSVIDMKILKDCLRIIRDEPEPAKKRTCASKQEKRDLLLRPASPAENNHSQSSASIPHQIRALHLHNSEDMGEQGHVGSGKESRQTECEAGQTEDSKGGRKTARLKYKPDPQPGFRTVARQPPVSSEAKPVQRAVPNGFCGICTKYIYRPKANAIMCSNSACQYGATFQHLSCLGLAVKMGPLQRQAFRCKACSLALKPP